MIVSHLSGDSVMSRQELEEYKAICDVLISMMREALDELDDHCNFFRSLREVILKSRDLGDSK